ncbi:four helix bundle protein [Candidatus Parcubacteria bacterium]|nr:four helix bundle protein [Patescibacteria group bacterium]MCG2686895.1 four helix bundle protein [Candidatus Parcubacteria bacterium]
MSEKITSFTKLIAWQKGHQLILEIYQVTKDFPKEEMFGLISQLRRAVVSYTSNIAEGFSRQTYKNKAHFYSISLGSLTEVQNQLLIAKDVGYIEDEKFNELASSTVELSKITNGLIKASRNKINSLNS